MGSDRNTRELRNGEDGAARTHIRPSHEHETMSVASLLKWTAVTQSRCAFSVLRQRPKSGWKCCKSIARIRTTRVGRMARWTGWWKEQRRWRRDESQQTAYLWRHSISARRPPGRLIPADSRLGCNSHRTRRPDGLSAACASYPERG